MRFLSDENIGLSVIKPLRNLGFDIRSIIEVAPGLSDVEVLSLANREKRILIATDKDFGEIVYVEKLVHKGVVLLRLRNDSTKNKLRVLQKLLTDHEDELENAFTVVTDARIRISKK